MRITSKGQVTIPQAVRAAWEGLGVTGRLRTSIDAMLGDHRGLSVATKLLHLKRPGLVPILDSLVVDQLGGRRKDGASLIEHVRREGRQPQQPTVRLHRPAGA